MRAWIVVALVAGACGSKDDTKTSDPTVVIAVPVVASTSVIAKDSEKPPAFYLVDAAGVVRSATAASWADFDARKITVATMPTDLAPKKAAEPEPEKDNEDKPDDGPEESGGTGSMITREESYYEKLRVEAAEKEKKLDAEQGPAIDTVDYSTRMPAPLPDGQPQRLADTVGSVRESGSIAPTTAVLLAPPALPARKLIELVRDSRAAIAVEQGGKVRPLRLSFAVRDGFHWGGWVEVRVAAARIVVEAVPDVPIELASFDDRSLAAALERARSTRGAERVLPVDVLVDADVTTQRLVDILVALDLAGVRTIGLGSTPNPEELARRGHRIPNVVIGMPNAMGDLDKKEIRRVIKNARPALDACFAKALAIDPTTTGTVLVQFLIKTNGAVASAEGRGATRELAICTAKVIGALVFPKPKTGLVQVNYPFTYVP
jgi:hypothetical protein